VTGAVIRTADRANPVVEAFAVREGRILALGSAADVERFRGRRTRTLEVGDAAVYPGFVDVHNPGCARSRGAPICSSSRCRRR
jgi:predicted amidohydrolase YtcJ